MVVVATGVSVGESEGDGEAPGPVVVGPNTNGKFKPFLGRGVVGCGRQSGSTCAVEAPVDCHLLCLCATAVYSQGSSASTTSYLLE